MSDDVAFAWVGFGGGLPQAASKGTRFTDPGGKVRIAREDLREGYIPWLDEGEGAWASPKGTGSMSNDPGNFVYITPEITDREWLEAVTLAMKAPLERSTRDRVLTELVTMRKPIYRVELQDVGPRT